MATTQKKTQNTPTTASDAIILGGVSYRIRTPEEWSPAEGDVITEISSDLLPVFLKLDGAEKAETTHATIEALGPLMQSGVYRRLFAVGLWPTDVPFAFDAVDAHVEHFQTHSFKPIEIYTALMGVITSFFV